jgi:hypothetical protein
MFGSIFPSLNDIIACTGQKLRFNRKIVPERGRTSNPEAFPIEQCPNWPISVLQLCFRVSYVVGAPHKAGARTEASGILLVVPICLLLAPEMKGARSCSKSSRDFGISPTSRRPFGKLAAQIHHTTLPHIEMQD